MWLKIAILHNRDIGLFHHNRRLYWTGQRWSDHYPTQLPPITLSYVAVFLEVVRMRILLTCPVCLFPQQRTPFRQGLLLAHLLISNTENSVWPRVGTQEIFVRLVFQAWNISKWSG